MTTDTGSLVPAGLRADYATRWAACLVRADRIVAVDAELATLTKNRPRYEAVAKVTTVPWYFIGIVHALEASFSFRTHLHNGDPLSARTVHVPAGRPKLGTPPFTWETSAIDALEMKGLHHWTEWDLAGLLYKLECYNGMGYRHRIPPVPSPYLWSFSDQYVKGKYDPEFVSRQCGGGTMLKRLVQTGVISPE